ncbi:Putative MAP kinase-activated protein kinase [Rhizopus microsporus]|nr:Putative MAP kinase-activated protein kinase [Rhizopus microsporus]
MSSSSLEESNTKKPQVIVGNYIIQDKIGQGSFATVYKAQHKETEQIVAVKSVKRSKLTKKLLENLESEISILTAIRHEHIVGLIDCQKTESNIYLVMEYCSLGDLSHYIKQVRTNKSMKRSSAGGLPERVVRHFLKQLASALQFLRSQNLVHRDIKPQNLLLAPNPIDHELPTLKVADFGFARFLPNASLADTLCGSPLYMGPEILSYKKYDAKADLWSVGAVLYEMVTGKPPFRAQNHLELLKKIQENNDQIHFPSDENSIGSDIKDLIRKLLKKNPVERLSFEDFFRHPAILVVKKPSTAPVRHYSASSKPNYAASPSPSPSSVSSSSAAPTEYEPPPFAYQSRRQSFHAVARQPKREEDVLQEYVVLDKRIIETNQFADELDASPRTLDTGRRLSTFISGSSPTRHTMTHAVNIPIKIPPSTPPPFIRERKSSTGSSAGSALARAISMASVRLFGTSIPSPPNKDLAGSPRGFMSSHHNAAHGTIEYIECIACMAHAVSKFGDQKYDTLSKSAEDDRQLAEECVVLYVKSLALLETGLYVAQQYWQRQQFDPVNDEKKNVARLNDAVQWMREKFNECLDRAESIQYDKQTLENTSVEKLLYDRALEMVIKQVW